MNTLIDDRLSSRLYSERSALRGPVSAALAEAERPQQRAREEAPARPAPENQPSLLSTLMTPLSEAFKKLQSGWKSFMGGFDAPAKTTAQTTTQENAAAAQDAAAQQEAPEEEAPVRQQRATEAPSRFGTAANRSGVPAFLDTLQNFARERTLERPAATVAREASAGTATLKAEASAGSAPRQTRSTNSTNRRDEEAREAAADETKAGDAQGVRRVTAVSQRQERAERDDRGWETVPFQRNGSATRVTTTIPFNAAVFHPSSVNLQTLLHTSSPETASVRPMAPIPPGGMNTWRAAATLSTTTSDLPGGGTFGHRGLSELAGEDRAALRLWATQMGVQGHQDGSVYARVAESPRWFTQQERDLAGQLASREVEHYGGVNGRLLNERFSEAIERATGQGLESQVWDAPVRYAQGPLGFDRSQSGLDAFQQGQLRLLSNDPLMNRGVVDGRPMNADLTRPDGLDGALNKREVLSLLTTGVQDLPELLNQLYAS